MAANGLCMQLRAVCSVSTVFWISLLLSWLVVDSHWWTSQHSESWLCWRDQWRLLSALQTVISQHLWSLCALWCAARYAGSFQSCQQPYSWENIIFWCCYCHVNPRESPRHGHDIITDIIWETPFLLSWSPCNKLLEGHQAFLLISYHKGATVPCLFHVTWSCRDEASCDQTLPSLLFFQPMLQSLTRASLQTNHIPHVPQKIKRTSIYFIGVLYHQHNHKHKRSLHCNVHICSLILKLFGCRTSWGLHDLCTGSHRSNWYSHDRVDVNLITVSKLMY